MKAYSFIEQVKQKFHYLVDDYGFSVVEEQYDPEVFGNSLVRFRSTAIEIEVVLDRGCVLVEIAPYPKVSDYQFNLLSIITFLAPEASEMIDVHPEGPPGYYGEIDWQINRLASLLQQYADPVLGFSKWEELNERRQQEGLRAYRELTGKDPIRIDSKAAWDIVEAERARRVAEQRRSTSQAEPPADKKGAESPIPWWAFWRRK